MINHQALHASAERYLEEVKLLLQLLPQAEVPAVAAVLFDAWQERRHVFVCGNGGSAATASHFVNDLNKGTHAPGKRRFRAVGLVDNTPVLMAWSNDTAYEHALSEQLLNFVEPGDVLVAISGSGNSPNVLNAVEIAQTHGAITVGMTGFSGGRLKPLVHHCLHVPSQSMEQVEDAHMILCHTLTVTLREMIANETMHTHPASSGSPPTLNGHHA